MWHQDAPYWPIVAPMTEVTAWVALDDADEDNGCMSMVPGSPLSKSPTGKRCRAKRFSVSIHP